MSFPNKPRPFRFETSQEAASEDLLRADDLLRSLPRVKTGQLSAWGLEPADRDELQTLAEVLKANAEGHTVVLTAASAIAMRRERRRFTRALVHFCEAAAQPVHIATLVPPRWSFTAQDLRRVSARDLRARFRTELRRAAGALEADGVIVGALHGEFDPATGRFQLHWHVACFGAARRWVEALRCRPSFRPTPHVARPIFVQLLRDPARQFSYLYKGFWLARAAVRRGQLLRRAGRPYRIPRPFHCVALRWLHRQLPADLLVVVGARLQGSRLRTLAGT